ncbi:MAG TPA: hypothetical protein VH415_00840 [Nitrososphaeraceae archaeon]|jgi:hypothetical protein
MTTLIITSLTALIVIVSFLVDSASTYLNTASAAAAEIVKVCDCPTLSNQVIN